MVFITIDAPVGRDIFVNREYASRGGTAPVTLVLSPGSHVFETLTIQGGAAVVDHDGSVTNVPDLASLHVSLAPVVPPRPVVLPSGVSLSAISASAPTV